nr:hypothetical protein [Candidatus Sigynarchaeota archaeon]
MQFIYSLDAMNARAAGGIRLQSRTREHRDHPTLGENTEWDALVAGWGIE